MKNLLYSIFILLSVISCKKDECDSSTLFSTLQGEWHVTISNQMVGQVEFHRDSTLTDELHLISESMENGEVLSIKTYRTFGNDLFLTEATTPSGDPSAGRNYFVTDYSCNAITTFYGSVEVRLTR